MRQGYIRLGQTWKKERVNEEHERREGGVGQNRRT